MLPVLHQALAEAKALPEDLSAIAVTKGPGLLGSLLVGTVAARTIASLWRLACIGVHHTFGHLSSPWLDSPPPVFPVLTLSASGGHTEMWYRTSPLQGVLIGSTLDDAAGEAFDKGAQLLGLPYPGGPSISAAATRGDPKAYAFAKPLAGNPTLAFSFSGLKTSLRYLLRDTFGSAPPPEVVPSLAASYQEAICRHLISRIADALKQYPDTNEVHLVGGVSANARLRALTSEVIGGRLLRVPAKMSYCTDNGAMIAAGGWLLKKERGDSAAKEFTTEASLALGEALL